MVIFALDFDGVLCDSCGELAQSAFVCAVRLWKVSDLFAVFTEIEVIPNWFLMAFRKVRPVLEIGYEAVLMIRQLVEARNIKNASCNDSMDDQDIAVENMIEVMLKTWTTKLLPQILEKVNLSISDVSSLLQAVRKEWILSNLTSFIQSNYFYNGVVESLLTTSSEVYIVTTKEQHLAITLLKEAGIDFPTSKVFGLGQFKSKWEIIQKLLQIHQKDHVHNNNNNNNKNDNNDNNDYVNDSKTHNDSTDNNNNNNNSNHDNNSYNSNCSIYDNYNNNNFDNNAIVNFVEDRLETLTSMSEKDEVKSGQVKLFLASWGYNMPEARLMKYDQISLISLSQFFALLLSQA